MHCFLNCTSFFCMQLYIFLCLFVIRTYGSTYPDGNTSQGGYADRVRVHEHFTFAIPEKLPSDVAAPLLCAVRTYHIIYTRVINRNYLLRKRTVHTTVG